ncbi:MAG: hypothetical protein CVT88_08945 [Candidatus Altiarchaeales archaeon HGW-Altiarchaeales-1]|nr:MAG: hypothetical protein CVT88_08945 [Candidatus Altiarchaeales archaeon HGW-Altiarchaeales-1]
MSDGSMIPIIFGMVVIIMILAQSIKIVNEYERGVIFRLGRLVGAKGPGVFFIIPIVDKWIKVDLRTIVFDIKKQNVITKDNVSIMVDAVVYYRVEDPCNAIVKVENYHEASVLRAETTIRDVLGQKEMDELLAKREELGKTIQEILDVATGPWGIKINAVTIKDVLLQENMTRAMAKQAEAEREKRSRIIMADGELQAAMKMREAAEEYTKMPLAMKLRELQTLSEIAREKNLIVVPSGAISGTSDIGSIVGITEGLLKREKVNEQMKE